MLILHFWNISFNFAFFLFYNPIEMYDTNDVLDKCQTVFK